MVIYLYIDIKSINPTFGISAITVAYPKQDLHTKVRVSHFEKDTYLYEISIATRWAKWHLEKKYG